MVKHTEKISGNISKRETIMEVSEEVHNKQMEQLKDLFDECDLDESGELCLEEMRIILSGKGYSDYFIEVSLKM